MNVPSGADAVICLVTGGPCGCGHITVPSIPLKRTQAGSLTSALEQKLGFPISGPSVGNSNFDGQ